MKALEFSTICAVKKKYNKCKQYLVSNDSKSSGKLLSFYIPEQKLFIMLSLFVVSINSDTLSFYEIFVFFCEERQFKILKKKHAI